MGEFTKPLVLHTPEEHSDRAGDAQSLLRHNRWSQDFAPGPVDRTWGRQSAGATARAKFWLGYPDRAINNQFGQQLYGFLLPLSSGAAAPLPLIFRMRRNARLRAARPAGKLLALQNARADALKHITESPRYSNCQQYGRRYGFNCVAWCFIALTCWYVDAKVPPFRLGSRWSYVPDIIDAARNGHEHLALTATPQPGDAVSYTTHAGPNQHIEIFDSWIEAGHTFWAVGGNTSNHDGVDSNGGEVVRQVRYVSNVTHFIRVGL